MKKFINRNSFKKSISGVAAIEFAIILPFLLIVLYGVYQVTTYVTTIRKIDNVTNDIAYILSREGNIATRDIDGNFSGGQARMLAIFQNTIPFLIYPYSYDPLNDNNSQIQVKYVGLPLPISCPTTAQNADGIDRSSVRVMWQERFPRDSATQISAEAGATRLCEGDNCPIICSPASGFGRYQSFYKDNASSRANIIYPGQSFILVDFAYNYDGLFSGGFPGVAPILPSTFEKFASYASRGQLQLGTMVNNMHYCTDCNIANSAYGGTNGIQQPGSGPVLRQACQSNAIINASASVNTRNSGGCAFY